jgi:hypothetical protein
MFELMDMFYSAAMRSAAAVAGDAVGAVKINSARDR